ncbi:MAG TPA: glycosyltransferase family 39 protein, partial [Pyrinomonadaceae bacterium]
MNEEIAAEGKIAAFLQRRRFVALLLVLHSAIALPLAYVLNIWTDEASSLHTTQNGFLQTFRNVFADEKQAPLYFLFLSLWRFLDDSVFFARLPSIVFSLLAIKFFYDLARKFLDENAARFVCVFFAVHPYLIWASAEIRVYSLVILLSVALLSFYADGYADSEPADETKTSQKRKSARIRFVLLAVLALYTNYYLGFLLVGGFVALIITRRFRAARNYFLQMLLVGVAFAPLLWIFTHQFADNADDFIETKSVAVGAMILFNQLRDFVFPTSFSASGELSAVSVVRLCFLALTAATIVFFLLKNLSKNLFKNLFKNRLRTIDEKVLLTGAFVLTTCAFLFAAYLALGSPYLAPRHFAVLFAPLALFVTVLISNVLPRKILIGFAASFALLFPYSQIYKQYSDFTKRGDWERVARFIERNEKPNQPIVVFRTYDALALPVYYTG